MLLYHENRSHGTLAFPLTVYSNHDRDGFYFVTPHWHEELEWIYVEEGALGLIIHGREYTLKEDEFCFINAGELHEIKSVGRSSHRAILFRPEMLDFALYDQCQHSFIGRVTGQKVLFPAVGGELPDEGRDIILGHMREIAGLFEAGNGGLEGDGEKGLWTFKVKLRILQVIEVLYEAGAFRENESTGAERESLSNLKAVIDYIHKNYAGSISLRELADMSYMSPNYFCGKFREEVGKTPIRFLNEYRIQQAARLLLETELQVSEVAVRVGFENISYFIRKFRECKGVTPAKYRQGNSSGI